MEHPAEYLLSRVRAEHPLSTPATTEELLRVCRQRGVRVIYSAELREPGLYVPEELLIVLRWPVSPGALAHELFHHLIRDNYRHEVRYHFPEFHDGDSEEEADLFAWLVCRENPEPVNDVEEVGEGDRVRCGETGTHPVRQRAYG